MNVRRWDGLVGDLGSNWGRYEYVISFGFAA